MSITHPSFGTLDDDRIIIFDTTCAMASSRQVFP